MTILILNAGGSTLKFRLFREKKDDGLEAIAAGNLSQFGSQAKFQWQTGTEEGEEVGALAEHGAATYRALDWIEQFLKAHPSEHLRAVGHRVVHGGDEFVEPVRLTDRTIARIEALNPLAPLHNPPALAVIRATTARLGSDVPMVAVFDTAFHHELPTHARYYALPASWTQAQGLRRYGFHGIAHRYMTERCAALTDGTLPSRLITLQLGNGCSAAAVRDGRCIDTSMGFTPLEGLVMATRSGDVDPGLLLYLLRQGIDPAQMDHGLNHESGLLGLSGLSADMKALMRAEADGHTGARRAIEAFCYRARKQIGAYAAALGGIDALTFGGGIGEHAAEIRARICSGLEWCDITLDADANRAAVGREARISARGGVEVYVIRVNEEALIARDTLACLETRADVE